MGAGVKYIHTVQLANACYSLGFCRNYGRGIEVMAICFDTQFHCRPR